MTDRIAAGRKFCQALIDCGLLPARVTSFRITCEGRRHPVVIEATYYADGNKLERLAVELPARLAEAAEA
jgi:hypothetical protein